MGLYSSPRSHRRYSTTKSDHDLLPSDSRHLFGGVWIGAKTQYRLWDGGNHDKNWEELPGLERRYQKRLPNQQISILERKCMRQSFRKRGSMVFRRQHEEKGRIRTL